MQKLSLTLVFAFAASIPALAVTVPVGGYTISGHTTTTGVHQSIDQGTLTGGLTFNSSGILQTADLFFADTTSGQTYEFSSVTSPSVSGNFDSATLLDTAFPGVTYAFSISLPSLLNGSYTLNCGTDCDTDAETPGGANGNLLNEEILGTISPNATTVSTTPEPGSLALLGTGLFGVVGAIRNRRGKA